MWSTTVEGCLSITPADVIGCVPSGVLLWHRPGITSRTPDTAVASLRVETAPLEDAQTPATRVVVMTWSEGRTVATLKAAATVTPLFLRCFPAVSRLFWRERVSLILYSSHAGARHSGRHCGVIRVPGGAVDLYRRRAGRRGALYQFRPGARGDTPPAPVFSTRETRWGTA